MEITYVKHVDIDKKKWDRCIENAPNGVIYAYSYYLDAMSESWDALVFDDYKIAMPLTWNKKYGISYLRQPAFSQQLGIFGSSSFEDNLVQAFIDKAAEHFPFIEINLNFANHYKSATAIRCNFILPLNKSFAETEKDFKTDLGNNVKKAKKNNLVYESSDEIENALVHFKHTYSSRMNITESNYNNFLRLSFLLKDKKQVFVRNVNSKEGKLLATGLFLKDKRRIYNPMSTVFPESRKLGANHFLFYKLIEEFSMQDLTFDFEGSEIPGINHFYRNFGSVEQNYFFVKINKLAPFQRLLKDAADRYKS